MSKVHRCWTKTIAVMDVDSVNSDGSFDVDFIFGGVGDAEIRANRTDNGLETPDGIPIQVFEVKTILEDRQTEMKQGAMMKQQKQEEQEAALEPTYAAREVSLVIPVKRWLVEDYYRYTVAELENGRFLVVHLNKTYTIFEEFKTFEDMYDDNGFLNTFPRATLLAVAKALGITHLVKKWNGKSVPVEEYFPEDEDEDEDEVFQ